MPKRLYIFSGKGGVGKSTISLAFAKRLLDNGVKVRHVAFGQNTALTNFNIPNIRLCIQQSTQEYLTRKIGSKLLAKAVMKTGFFKSLLAILPGLEQMILLGDLLDRLERDNELTLVVDSPASGHVLTLFESPLGFKSIFKVGPLVKDIDRMLGLMHSKGFLKVIVLCLPTEMSLQEGVELQERLGTYSIHTVQVVLNNFLAETFKDAREDLPPFFRQKIDLERELAEKFSHHLHGLLPHNVSGMPAPTLMDALS